MEKLNVDYGIPGNHDLDEGPEIFNDLVKNLKTKWILSNLRLKTNQ